MDAAEEIRDAAKAAAPKRTGVLAASIVAEYRGDDAWVGPTGGYSTNGPYGRAVSLGGMRVAHNPSGRMWWPTGVWSESAVANMMPANPYFEASVEATSGARERIYYDHWLRAQEAI